MRKHTYACKDGVLSWQSILDSFNWYFLLVFRKYGDENDEDVKDGDDDSVDEYDDNEDNEEHADRVTD